MSLTEGGSLSKADIKSAAQALAQVNVNPVYTVPPFMYWEARLILAKDAQERRAVRRKIRRTARYAKIAAKKLLDVPKIPYQVFYTCPACGAEEGRENPCVCQTEGVQCKMDFIPRQKTTFAQYDDFVTFQDLLDGKGESILKGPNWTNAPVIQEYIDAAVSQLGETMAYNFGQSIDALAKLTADPVADLPGPPYEKPSPVSF
jgi:hypothetical protein